VCARQRYSFTIREGLIWIEDLGERDLWSYRGESWAIRRPFYESALEEIAKLHRVSAADSAEIRADLPAQFDAALYLWETTLFLRELPQTVISASMGGICMNWLASSTDANCPAIGGLPAPARPS
jgi:hypothetical protein